MHSLPSYMENGLSYVGVNMHMLAQHLWGKKSRTGISAEQTFTYVSVHHIHRQNKQQVVK